MTLYEYLMLDSQEQLTSLLIGGTLISKTNVGSSSFVLYALDTFYIEFEYLEGTGTTKGETLLLSKYIFKSGKRLDKYLVAV